LSPCFSSVIACQYSLNCFLTIQGISDDRLKMQQSTHLIPIDHYHRTRYDEQQNPSPVDCCSYDVMNIVVFLVVVVVFAKVCCAKV
jgi:hypothetical protein